MTLNCFECIKLESQRIINLLDLPRLVTKKWIEVYDQPEKNTMLTTKLELKLQC